MTPWHQTLEVARWEFRRFFKLRDQVVSLVIAVATAAGAYGTARWIGADPGRPSVAMLGAADAWRGALRADAEPVDTLGRDEAALRAAVADGELDGLLVVSGETTRLVVRKASGWQGRIVLALQREQQRARLAGAGFEGDRLRKLLEPLKVSIEQVSPAAAVSRAERLAAIVAGALMLIGIWSGLAFMFVGITGEKQLRVTEQVVAAITPQTWVDGKILGLSAVAAVTTCGYVVSALVLSVAARGAGLSWTWPDALAQPLLVVVIALLAVLGFAFWNTFIAVIAATITDPNSSNRGGFIMAPLFPVLVALLGLRSPDATAMRVLSVFPPTAPCVMLTRLVVGEPAWWEIALALVLLGAASWAMRVLAGRIFRLGMLAYGKEPSWRELWRWAREAA